MNILMVGVGSGSYQMRGIQLGGAIGARVTAAPEPSDWAWADVVVLVKRAAIQWQAQARRLKVPVVWDVLDFWNQPEDNSLAREEMIAKVKAIQEAAGVSVLIGATRAMADDIGGVYLTHHCRLGLSPGQLRDRAEVVGYDGTSKYLGRWRAALEQSCEDLGLRFVVNPPDIRTADVLVSFRDGRWDGWACRRWKSGVKLVNALVAGRPIVSQPSAACDEACDEKRLFGALVETTEGLTEAIGLASSLETRAKSQQYGRATQNAYQLPAVAREYATILQQAARRAA